MNFDDLLHVFRQAPRPRHVRCNSWARELSPEDVYRLIDTDPRDLEQHDFHSLIDSWLYGCMEDTRGVLPGLLYFWKQDLPSREGWFCYFSMTRLVAFDYLERGLDETLRRAATDFMFDAVFEQIADCAFAPPMNPRGCSQLNLMGILSTRFPELWGRVWAADRPRLATAVLQYVADLAGERVGDPLSDPEADTRRVSIVTGLELDDEFCMRPENVSFMREELELERILAKLDQVSSTFRGTDLDACAARLRQVVASRSSLVREGVRSMLADFERSERFSFRDQFSGGEGHCDECAKLNEAAREKP